ARSCGTCPCPRTTARRRRGRRGPAGHRRAPRQSRHRGGGFRARSCWRHSGGESRPIVATPFERVARCRRVSPHSFLPESAMRTLHRFLPSRRPALAALAVAVAAGLSAAFSVPTDPPVFTIPLDFTNEWQPFVEGGVKVFQGKSDGEATVVVDIYLADT